MKELLESYIIEKVQLQEQVGLLVAVITAMMPEDTHSWGYPVDELPDASQTKISVDDGDINVYTG